MNERNEVIKNLENHINKSFEKLRFHDAIKFSLVLLHIDNENAVGKNILEKSKIELSELCFSQGYIEWYSSYLNTSFFTGNVANNDPYKNTIYKTYEDGYNAHREKIKDKITTIFAVIFIIAILIYFNYF